MTVGQEFHAFAASLESEIQFLKQAEKSLYAVNMGATAIGTGINVPKGYPEKCAAHLAELTGKPIVPASDMLAATWDQQGFVVYSSALRSTAIKLSKIANDLILLTSGPRAGLFEINLPALQPGSSIMPGKVNPVIPELVNLIAFRVIGNDYSVSLAGTHGQLQLNAYEPIEGLGNHRISKPAVPRVDRISLEVRRRHYRERKEYCSTTWKPRWALSPRSIPSWVMKKRRNSRPKPTRPTKEFSRSFANRNFLRNSKSKQLLDPVKLTGLDKSQYVKKD